MGYALYTLYMSSSRGYLYVVLSIRSHCGLPSCLCLCSVYQETFARRDLITRHSFEEDSSVAESQVGRDGRGLEGLADKEKRRMRGVTPGYLLMILMGGSSADGGR